jgi:nucleoside 2-deoxyribosyltransferase
MLSVAYAKHVEELRSLLGALDELGYLKGPEVLGSQDYSLTLSGFSEAERMAAVTESDQCFVALWFDDKMRDVFNTSITAAAEKCGYKAMIIPMKEHNDDITDHIIAEIRRSRFIIADFTGLRGGVYYEAGFAAGLGKPVIYTCRKDWFNTTVKVTTQVEGSDGPVQVKMDEQRFVHFDLSQMNFIVWETGEALEARLIDRIAATIV